MADNAWSQSECREDVWWYGVPGQGCYYWTEWYGTRWTGGIIYQTYARHGYECGWLGAPTSNYGWIAEYQSNGQWFEGGAILANGWAVG
jgi:hypothetical protein